MIQHIATWGTLAATVATALATFFLWRVTGFLATETKRMADAAASPMIVVSLYPNQWSMIHFDISVSNTGNSTAFDIEISFDPEIKKTIGDDHAEPSPFKNISLLKPNQELSSYLTEFSNLKGKKFNVIISWKTRPSAKTRETLSYAIDMEDYENVGSLGVANPVVQIAEQIKKLREDWQQVAHGSKRIKAEVYDGADRREEKKARDEWRERQKSRE